MGKGLVEKAGPASVWRQSKEEDMGNRWKSVRLTVLASTLLVMLMNAANAQDGLSNEAPGGAKPPSTSAVLEKIAELVDQNNQLIGKQGVGKCTA